MPSPLRLTRATSAPTPTSGVRPVPETHSPVPRRPGMPRLSPAPRLLRVPRSVRRVVLLVGVIVAVVGLPGTVQAAANPAASATLSAGTPPMARHVLVAGAPPTAGHVLVAGTPTQVSQPARPAGATCRAGAARPRG